MPAWKDQQNRIRRKTWRKHSDKKKSTNKIQIPAKESKTKPVKSRTESKDNRKKTKKNNKKKAFKKKTGKPKMKQILRAPLQGDSCQAVDFLAARSKSATGCQDGTKVVIKGR